LNKLPSKMELGGGTKCENYHNRKGGGLKEVKNLSDFGWAFGAPDLMAKSIELGPVNGSGKRWKKCKIPF